MGIVNWYSVVVVVVFTFLDEFLSSLYFRVYK